MELKKFWFFESLSSDELKRLKNITHKKHYNKGEILFYKGDTPSYLYLLASGVVKLYKHDFKENEVVLHNLSAPNLIAEIANFEELPYPASCAFECASTVYCIDYEKFKTEFLSKNEIAMVFLKSLTKKIKALESFINYSITADSFSKTAKFLYENEEILKSIKQIKIAALLNITPETLSRNLTKLKEAKIVQKVDGYIQILNYERLKKVYM